MACRIGLGGALRDEGYGLGGFLVVCTWIRT